MSEPVEAGSRQDDGRAHAGAGRWGVILDPNAHAGLLELMGMTPAEAAERNARWIVSAALAPLIALAGGDPPETSHEHNERLRPYVAHAPPRNESASTTRASIMWAASRSRADRRASVMLVLYGITAHGADGFKAFPAVRCADGWRSYGPRGPLLDVTRKSGSGLHRTEAEAWRAWKRWLARLACGAKDTHRRHVETLRRYRDKGRA